MAKMFCKRAVCVVIAVLALFVTSAVSFAEAAEKVPIKQLGTYGQQARIADYDNCLTESEEAKLLEIMQKAAKSAKCNIGVVITKELDGKSDEKYTEDFLDDNFGRSSYSVVLMLFNSYNRPQYSSATDVLTESQAIRSRFQSKSTKILDNIYDKMGEPIGNKYAYNETTKTYGGYDYYAAVKEFARNVKRYGSGGFIKLGAIIGDYITGNFTFFAGGLVIAFLIMFAIVGAKVRGYKRKATLSASNYLDRRATRVTRQVDQFVREYTTSHTHSSSSGGHGGGHGGGGGHHSSHGHHT